MELYYDAEIGHVDAVTHSVFPDRIFLDAEYYLDLTKSQNMRNTLAVVQGVFGALSATGIQEVYCLVNNQSSYNFNSRLGFISTKEVADETYEVMKKVL